MVLKLPFHFRRELNRFPVKLTDPVTAVLYITADKVHMEELKHAIHVREIAEGNTVYMYSEISFLND